MFDSSFTAKSLVTVVFYDGSAFPPHSDYTANLPHCELIYTLSGESIVNFAGNQVTEKTDTIRFLPKGNRPDTAKYTVDRIEQGDCIDIYFDTDSYLTDEMLFLELRDNRKIRNMFIKIQQFWYAKHTGYYHKCMSLLYAIFAEINKVNDVYLPEEKYHKKKPAIEYIDNNFLSVNIDCNILSDLCGVSYSYFKRLFIMKFGISPIKYITKKKIMYACDLLISNKYSVSEIAEIIGYENVYYFSRVFKETTGMSPTEFRKRP